jgi:hypothetical protein
MGRRFNQNRAIRRTIAAKPMMFFFVGRHLSSDLLSFGRSAGNAIPNPGTSILISDQDLGLITDTQNEETQNQTVAAKLSSDFCA